METDNFAHIINERKKRYEAYAQWDREAAETYKKLQKFFSFFVPFLAFSMIAVIGFQIYKGICGQ